MLKIRKILDKIIKIRTKGKKYKTLYAAGHYHSPIPCKEDVLKNEHRIFGLEKKAIEGVDLNETEQVKLLEEVQKYYKEIPFSDIKKEGLRYYFNNGAYMHSDAIFLYGVMRYFKPNKIIEIGSGFSSALMLDVNEHFLDNNAKCYFIEPYPRVLLSLLSESDKRSNEIIESYVQDVDLGVFEQLKENDILFIDSSHVSKTGSDLNYILFKILPGLKSGVLIHFHDIFYPFEYPKEWVLAGRAWNECYLLRAFLQYNNKFKIALFNTFLEKYYESWFREKMPLCLVCKGGSIWLRKNN